MRVHLAALGLVTPLGSGKAAVAAALRSGARDGLVLRDDLVSGRSMRVGAVCSPLPRIPDHLSRFACRNNQLALAALEQIRDPLLAALDRYGADRIAVILGTSTSGIAEGEEA